MAYAKQTKTIKFTKKKVSNKKGKTKNGRKKV
jgi:hypothetical protein